MGTFYGYPGRLDNEGESVKVPTEPMRLAKAYATSCFTLVGCCSVRVSPTSRLLLRWCLPSEDQISLIPLPIIIKNCLSIT